VQSTTAPQYMIGSNRNARDADLIFYANLQMCPSPGGYQLHLQPYEQIKYCIIIK